MAETKKETVEKYKFELIKGYPMLNWRGKRPFTSTQFYPAQLKESFGTTNSNEWINKIFWGDNLQVMSHLLKNYRGRIDLVYIDPPFDSKADYKKTIKVKRALVQSDVNVFEEKQYSDIWANDQYLQYLYERIILIKELMSGTGSIYVHCDYRKSAHIRLILDEVFGSERFINEIAWQRIYSHSDANKFGVVHDTIFLYSKTANFTFNKQFRPHAQSYIESHYGQKDKNGRNFRLVTLSAAGAGPSRKFGERGEIAPPPGRHWAWSQEKIDEGLVNGKIVFTSTGQPNIKKYLDESEGTAIPSVWTDIYSVNPASNEQTNYPTQKPEALLERIIKASSNEGDVVFDCFMGSGVVPVVASKLSRKFIACDMNQCAIQTSVNRLVEVPNTSFQLFHVNNYEVFRNPVEAKEILKEALEITPILNSIYDGEKDGRMVKIMPINRIATRADLNELINGFDYKIFKKRKELAPNKPVEKILLVCMGHEVDLKASLELAIRESGFELDIDVVDILRDKAEIQFKRDPEARVNIKKGKLLIEKFYPMNLLQKLSLQKSKIEDWKELVESVMIDWNYDGAVLSPTVIDIPEKNSLVAGEYEIPKDAGTIRVKITDLLSESLEIEVSNG